MRAMTAYTLKFYCRAGVASTNHRGVGNVTFNVGDDATAIRYVEKTHVDSAFGCDYAVLHSEAGGIVWESGSL
jgi:hypothetical protein